MAADASDIEFSDDNFDDSDDNIDQDEGAVSRQLPSYALLWRLTR